MTAYERLQAAAKKANEGAGILALRKVRAVHWECRAIEAEWADRTGSEADAVRAVVARIDAALDLNPRGE